MGIPELEEYVPTAIDLFAGAGGLSTGLEMAGYSVLYANEIVPAYAETLERNHPNTWVDVRDIRDVNPEDVLGQLAVKPGELDLVAGGPPCQGFSINAPIRSLEDQRNHLFWGFLRFVEAARPKAVLIENVPGMVSFEGGHVVDSILRALSELGYKARLRILYAAHYGVPQMRWRTVFIAIRGDRDPLAAFPRPTHHAFGRANFRRSHNNEVLVLSNEEVARLASREPSNVEAAISDLPPIENGGGSSSMAYALEPQNRYQEIMRSRSHGDRLMNHQCAGLGPANLARLPHIPPGGSWRDIPFDLLPKGMKRARRSDHTQRYGRLHPDGLASTILTKCDPHWGAFVHPHQDRVLSVRESARLQSFPDHVVFLGSLVDQYAQVGNAVPPLLAEALGLGIRAFFDDQGIDLRDSDNGFSTMQLELLN